MRCRLYGGRLQALAKSFRSDASPVCERRKLASSRRAGLLGRSAPAPANDCTFCCREVPSAAGTSEMLFVRSGYANCAPSSAPTRTCDRLQPQFSEDCRRSGLLFPIPLSTPQARRSKIDDSPCGRTTHSWNVLGLIRSAGTAFEYRNFFSKTMIPSRPATGPVSQFETQRLTSSGVSLFVYRCIIAHIHTMEAE